jgi:hypothetical protein
VKNKDYKLDKMIYEGWTVKDFIEELAPMLRIIMSGRSWRKPLANKVELRKWVGENQPCYKKPVSQVVNYFADTYGIA